MVNYTVSDMLTRLRNAIRVKKTKVILRSTELTKRISDILKREGYIEESYEISTLNKIQKSESRSPVTKLNLGSPVQHLNIVQKVEIKPVQKIELELGFDSATDISAKTTAGRSGPQKELHIFLKYEGKQMLPVLTHLKTISRPGVRFYANAKEIPQVLGGLGITILSTSKGILTDTEARSLGIGGEILCMVW